MKSAATTLMFIFMLTSTAEAQILSLRRSRTPPVPRLAGRVVDYTNNHGQDRRIYSPALKEKRDMYVYIPPGFDANKAYPIVIYLHGVMDDERGFLQYVAKPVDQAIQCGLLPPLIVAAPDGSLSCAPHGGFQPGSFFLNSRAGAYQDYIVQDVWNFMITYYPIRGEAEAHILVGVSMGGFAAYNIGIKHHKHFKIIVGVLPVLNLRWVGLDGDYFANFHPNNWGWRNSVANPREVIGRFLHGLIKIRVEDFIYPIFGKGVEAIWLASLENPIEMIDRYKIKKNTLDMFIGYGGRDEFNLDAHAESFLYLVRSRGIQPTVHYEPKGTHSAGTALKMLPSVIRFIGGRLKHYNIWQPLPMPKNDDNPKPTSLSHTN